MLQETKDVQHQESGEGRDEPGKIENGREEIEDERGKIAHRPGTKDFGAEDERKAKKCKKKGRLKKEQKGEGDEWNRIEDVGEEERKMVEEERKMVEEERDVEDENAVAELDEEEMLEGVREEEMEDEDSEEYTTCSGSEEPRPQWDDMAEDDLGFLLLMDPGIYEALQFKGTLHKLENNHQQDS